MKVITDIYFDDLKEKVNSSEGYDFLETIDDLNLKDALMALFENEYWKDYPELEDIIYDIEKNSSELMERLGIVDITSVSDGFKNIYKQLQIAISRCKDEELSEALDDLSYLLDDSEIDYLNLTTKENLREFADDCARILDKIDELNNMAYDDYRLVKSISDESNKLLVIITNIIK